MTEHQSTDFKDMYFKYLESESKQEFYQVTKKQVHGNHQIKPKERFLRSHNCEEWGAAEHLRRIQKYSRGVQKCCGGGEADNREFAYQYATLNFYAILRGVC